jgi:hypothetical protein
MQIIKEVIKMKKKTILVVISMVLGVVLTFSIGAAAAAADPVNGNGCEACSGQESGFGGQGRGQDMYSDAVCKLLGMTADEIQALRCEGKSLVQIAATKGVSQQQLLDVIMAERKADVQSRVTAGTLTQERAAIMLQQMEQNTVRSISRTSSGPPEWAGANGVGQGAGNGQMNNGQCGTDGNGCGEPGSCTGAGNMNKRGICSR